MNPRIVSVSRRTDVPAFYGDWFMNRIRAGYAGYVNPFGGARYLVDLRPERVLCFVFWSKNFAPFIEHLRTLTDRGYRALFHFTITGLPGDFEPDAPPTDAAVDTLKRLADGHDPRVIGWRYDPIVLSDRTPFDWHVQRFEQLAASLRGAAARCYFSFAFRYGKVRRSFEAFQARTGVRIEDPDMDTRRRLASALADLAAGNGMTLHSCCGDALVSGRVLKAHCVDGALIRSLFEPAGAPRRLAPTRAGCGCAQSVDIGAYDTCPHGCIYCYANRDPARAAANRAAHDPQAAFLGQSRAMSDRWVAELRADTPPEPPGPSDQMPFMRNW